MDIGIKVLITTWLEANVVPQLSVDMAGLFTDNPTAPKVRDALLCAINPNFFSGYTLPPNITRPSDHSWFFWAVRRFFETYGVIQPTWLGFIQELTERDPERSE
jgi:hypothetical protein